jgi:sensor histidine kinase YesM
MPAASRALSSQPDILAVAPAGVVRSRVQMDSAMDTQARLKRAKERMYVLCQLGGWGILLLMQLGFAGAAGDPSQDRLKVVSINVMIFLQGLLLTHYIRPLMTRWGWKELGWRALVPRVLLTAIGLAVTWNVVGFGYCYGILQLPWPPKVSFPLVVFASLIQSIMLIAAWLCIYFFYHIYERLQRMQVEQLRLEATAKEAELRALKSQVNPHFLFNSLNSLRALIDEDAPRAREAVTRLANMLRYSLQSGQQETVPLEDEIRIVEDYLALEHIRHEDRLRVRWDIPADVRLLTVPPMLLQTLVENAVKYGISTRREGGELGIAARITGATLNIRVTNPGDLSAPTSAAAARAGSSTGVGLRNASERLKLLFGDRAALTLLAEPAGCVTADVVIPLNPPA